MMFEQSLSKIITNNHDAGWHVVITHTLSTHSDDKTDLTAAGNCKTTALSYNDCFKPARILSANGQL